MIRSRMPEFVRLPDGAKLAYELIGNGPALVLLHGFSLDRRMWREVVPRLARRRAVIVPDLRGFGESDPPHGPYSHTDDIATLLDGLGVPRAAVAGLSMGGGIAIDFALAHPKRITALAVFDSVLGGFKGWTLDWNLRERERTLNEIKAAWLAHALFAWSARDPGVAARMAEMVSAYSGWHWQNADPKTRTGGPAIQRLDRIAAPTLVVAGAHDHPDFVHLARLIAGGIPGATLDILPDCGHLPPLEAPVQVAEILERFLDAQDV